MSKPLIIGRLEYSNSRDLILIDEHALKIGDTIYLKNTLKNGRSHWIGYMLDYGLESKEWYLCGIKDPLYRLLGKVAKIYL